MTSPLPPEAEALVQEAAKALYRDGGTQIVPILRDLARRLLEPGEKCDGCKAEGGMVYTVCHDCWFAL